MEFGGIFCPLFQNPSGKFLQADSCPEFKLLVVKIPGINTVSSQAGLQSLTKGCRAAKRYFRRFQLFAHPG